MLFSLCQKFEIQKQGVSKNRISQEDGEGVCGGGDLLSLIASDGP